MSRRHIILLVLMWMLILPSYGQSIPKLKRAEEVNSGVFPNGVEYFFVENTPVAGRADFALVQIGDFSVDETRHTFVDAEHLNPKEYLSRNGIHYTEDGFVSYYEGARVFRFPDVNVKDRASTDSTFLMMLDFMLQSTGPQTIIVCGDIDQASFKERFSTLSLVVPQVQEQEYVSSIPKEGAILRNDARKGFVSFSFQEGTANREQAGTAVPLMSQFLFLQVRNILKDRVELAFKTERIPYYIDILENEVNVCFDQNFETQARQIISDAVSDLCNGGATEEELTYAKYEALPEVISKGLKPGKSNSFYVERCIASIISGSNLASEETLRSFFSRRKISPKRELELFNNYSHALLSSISENDEADFKYKRQSCPDLQAALRVPSKGVKLANVTTDPLTGGKHWTFSNGMKVVYKYLPSTEGFNFCLSLRGGASSMENLYPGESRFLPDMILLNRFSGIEGYEFDRALRTRGIEFQFDITLGNTIFAGNAPSSQISTVLRALLKFAYGRQSDAAAFDFYRQCQRLRSTTELPSIHAVMDSLMCRDYAYQANSSAYNIKDALMERTDAFLDQRFSNASDGVFIIIGNVSEADLLNELCRHLGSFDVSGPYAVKESVRYNLYSGRTTFIEKGDEESVNLAATGFIPVTIDNYLTFLLAKEAISRQLAKSLLPVGMYVQVEGKMDVDPMEKVSYYVTLKSCPQDGLPEGVESYDPMDAINVVREEFSRMQYMAISPEEFESYKEIVKKTIAAQLSSQKGMMDYALCRYSFGRDLTTAYRSRLDALVVDDLRWLLEEVISSGIVEYIVK